MNAQHTEAWLTKMKDVDIVTVDPANLVDVTQVKIDESLPVGQRVADFITQVKNPYCFRVGKVAVKIAYQPTGPTFQQNMEDLLRTLQR